MSSPRHGSRRFYVLAMVAYLSVVVGLAALALFGRGTSARLGDARVAAHYAALPLFGRVVDRASVSYRGLRLSLDPGTPVELSSGGTPARLREMRSHDDGIDLGFERGIRLELRRSDDGAWSLAFTGATGETLSVSVRLRVPGGLAPTGEAPMVSWRRGAAAYYLSLPRGSQVDPTSGSLVLKLASGSRELRFGPSLGQDLSARWLSDQAALIDAAGFRTARDTWLAQSWQGWTKTRRSADGMRWQGADGRFVFDEDLGTALLAEAIERGDYPAQRAVVGAAFDLQLRTSADAARSAAESAYVGNLREYVRRVRAAEAPGVERIRKLLAERDPQLFLVPGLVPFVLDHGPFNLVQEIVTLAGTLRTGSLEPSVALGLLEVYLDYDRYVVRGTTMADRSRDVIRRRLIPSIRKTDDGLFLETAPGRVDTIGTLRCGALLVRSAAALNDAQAAAVGRTLIASAVALGRPNGFLPGTLTLAGGAVKPLDGSPAVAPEAVYRFVAPDRHLPREIPLHLDVGPGASVWTAADLVAAEGSSTGLRLTLAFPAGLPHYLLVDGVRSVAKLELHGIAWRSAPDYAQYSDGWTYDPAEQLLFVKLTGRTDTEDLVVTY